MSEDETYQEKMDRLKKMVQDAVEEKGYVCRVSDVEGSSSVGYDLYGVYICERDRYIVEFGEDEEKIGE